ncbi:hypothetical protein NG895_07205 [Aeoliella sp. ICT_H6.2]|uniref:Dockerin domain-containing protein n=1 Tax=Aeoliella straminimaris TaxID=2954799 RepID=A0A9X2JF51_9BACT|nr:dockerin type I domain-containing protein [Aeoliella straminimaris]MCO6043690.1 hypothetical protein [Aeoliella straminimaris]
MSLVPADTTFELSDSDSRIRGNFLLPLPLHGEYSGRYAAVRFTASPGSEPTNEIGGHEFRFLEGPSDLVLEIDRADGSMTMHNNGATNDSNSPESLQIRGYSISSPSEALDDANFSGLAGNSGFPTGTGSGSGWEVAGGSNGEQIIDAYYGGFPTSSTISAGATGLDLGEGYDIYSFSEDVSFIWTDAMGRKFDGRVVYVGDAPTDVPGDYNGDGAVDLADYTVWRNTLGAAGAGLSADGNGDNVVDADDYGVWKQYFGRSTAGTVSSVSSAAVPEPSTFVLAATCIGLLAARRR